MIVVVGSLNMDLVVRVPRHPTPGETLLGSDYETHAGGKGANQAVAAARCGGEVRMVGRVGLDAYGKELLGALKAEGVDASAVERAETKTGAAFISVDNAGQNSIIVSPGANHTLLAEQLEARLFPGSKVVLIQLEIPLETALRAAELGRAAGATVVLNAAPALALERAQLGSIDLLLVNESEAATLLEAGSEDAGLEDASLIEVGLEEVGSENSSAATADLQSAPNSTAESTQESERDRTVEALRAYAPTVILTQGAKGVSWAGAQTRGSQRAFEANVVDTTAAGDAFAGALAVALERGQALDAAVRYAAAAGALSVGQRGAIPSLPTHREIERFLAGAKERS